MYPEPCQASKLCENSQRLTAVNFFAKSFILVLNIPLCNSYSVTAQKMKFSVKDFFSKCDHIRRKLRIWSHLLKKFLMESFIFVQCVVLKNSLTRISLVITKICFSFFLQSELKIFSWFERLPSCLSETFFQNFDVFGSVQYWEKLLVICKTRRNLLF